MNGNDYQKFTPSRQISLALLLTMLLTLAACQPLGLLQGSAPAAEEPISATATPVEEVVPLVAEVVEPEPTEEAAEEPAEEPVAPVAAVAAAISSTISATVPAATVPAATEPPATAPSATETVEPAAAVALTETAEISTTLVMTDAVSEPIGEGSAESATDDGTEAAAEAAAEPVLTIADLRAREAADTGATEAVTATVSVSDSVSETITTDSGAVAVATTAGRTALFASIITDGSNLNVRDQPSINGAVIAKLPREAVVELLEQTEQQDWYRVEISVDGSSGWIFAQFAELIELDTAEEDAAPDAVTSEVETDTDLSASGAVTDSIELAATNAITDLWAFNDSLQTTVTVEFDLPTAITQPENMNVRAGPGTNYPPVTVAPAGTQYEILATNPQGDWYQVRIPDLDDPGWIFASLAEAVGPIDAIPTLAEEDVPEPPAEPEASTVSAASASAATVNAPPPAGGGFFGYGVQAHMLGGGRDAAMDATANLGFNWIKQQVQWREFEGSPGAVDFSELRRIADAASGRGISVLFSVVNAPDWAREGGFDPNVGGPPADPQSYANFVGRLAGEFCGSGLEAIEVWNEQNLHYEWGNKPLNPAEYMNLLRAAYGSIKGACPSMLVISGAPTPAGPNGNLAMDDFAYLEAMYQNGLAGVADGIGVHPSGYNVPPSVDFNNACATIQQTGNTFNGACDTPHHSWSFLSTMLGYRNIMNVYGDANKRLWPTEFGWAAGGALHPAYAYANDNDFNEQAAWTVEAFQLMRDWGWVGPAFLWNLNFRVIADGTEKAQWGIVRNDYTPLPIYDALRNMPK